MDARSTLILALGTLGAASAYALSRSARNGPAEGVNWDSLPYDVLDAAEVLVNRSIETPADVSDDVAGTNVAAFLAMIRAAEGTGNQPDPYRVVMGYGYTLQDLSEHPAITHEWDGAYFVSNGERKLSTAAGAYQIKRSTWIGVRDKLGLPDFSPASQDAAAIELIRQRGALENVKAGRFADALVKVRREWASMPGAGYGQGERPLDWLAQVYTINGGTIA